MHACYGSSESWATFGHDYDDIKYFILEVTVSQEREEQEEEKGRKVRENCWRKGAGRFVVKREGEKASQRGIIRM